MMTDENEWMEAEQALAALREYRRERQREALCGPLVSGLFHVGLLVLLSILVVDKQRPVEPEVEVTVTRPENRPVPPKLQLPEPKPQRPDDLKVALPTLAAALSSDLGSPDEAMSEAVEAVTVTTAAEALALVEHLPQVRGPGQGSPYSGRTEKERGRTPGDPSPEGQTAVMRALRWLAAVQRDDGSWEGAPAPSGLALLCFLAHGETPGSEEFGDTVGRGIRWLAESMPATGAWGTGDRHVAYAHAIATYALAEAYGMTRISLVAEPLERGVGVILAGQQPNGGFDYHYRHGGRWDTSVTGWQVQALVAAHHAGASNRGLATGIRRAVGFLETVAYADGRFGYTARGRESGSQSMTGIATVGLQMSGNGARPAAVAGGQRVLSTKLATWERAAVDWSETASHHLYGWYYDTQAVYHHSDGRGPDWEPWNRAFQTALLRAQNEAGYWTHAERHGMGGDSLHGKVLSTALCCLQLEVYYRHLIGSHAIAADNPEAPPLLPADGRIQIR